MLLRFGGSVWGKAVDSRVASFNKIIYMGMLDSCCRNV